MIGTAIEVCRGRLDEQVFRQLLFHVDENDEKLSQFVRDDNPCKPSPPEGLTLERVFYEGDF
jgi:tRNA U38,U39,U40 pseudouridine synthase TruA